MNVACLQVDIQFGHPEQNKKIILNTLDEAMEKSPDVIVLPELWTTGYDLERLNEIADIDGNDTKQFIGLLAKQYKVNIIAGSIAKKVDERITNTTYIFNREGKVISEYSKAHLFKLMNEHLYLQHGNTKGQFELEGTLAASLICYDIRFPEWVQAHTTNEARANIIFIVAQWPLARLDHWLTLLRSRAIENQCYIVACNRSGNDPNNQFAGHSVIYNPWGEVVAEAGLDSCILHASLQLETVAKIREQIPIFEDRRPDLY